MVMGSKAGISFDAGYNTLMMKSAQNDLRVRLESSKITYEGHNLAVAKMKIFMV